MSIKLESAEQLSIIWDYWKPRHTYAWNMFVISSNTLQATKIDGSFELEYAWENYIIRLWLYRAVVKTLVKFHPSKRIIQKALKDFDKTFSSGGINALKTYRDMIEHFDDYALGKGRGPASREVDLDPWRSIGPDKYERGRFHFDRNEMLVAANELRLKANTGSDAFIKWYNINKTP